MGGFVSGVFVVVVVVGCCCCCRRCQGEVRVGCCFTQWVRCIPIVIIADVAVIPEIHTAHKTPTKNVSCEVKAMSVPRFEYCCSFLMNGVAALLRYESSLHYSQTVQARQRFLTLRAVLQSGKNFCDKLN